MLSAADLQVVVMGERFLGIKHPCKIYNILQVGADVLYIGPEPSHITEICERAGDGPIAFFARQGDVRTVTEYIRAAAKRTLRTRRPSLPKDYTKLVVLPALLKALQGVQDNQKGPDPSPSK